MKEIIIKQPKQARSKEKFSAILSASSRVMAEYGYNKSSCARIALEADVGVATLYDYFSCKEAVFIAYLDRELELALAKVYQLSLDREVQAKQLLHTLLMVGVTFALEQKELIKALVTESVLLMDHLNFQQSAVQIEAIAYAFVARLDPSWKPHAEVELMLYTLTNIVVGSQLRLVFLPDDSFSPDEIVTELSAIVAAYIGFD